MTPYAINHARNAMRARQEKAAKSPLWVAALVVVCRRCGAPKTVRCDRGDNVGDRRFEPHAERRLDAKSLVRA